VNVSFPSAKEHPVVEYQHLLSAVGRHIDVTDTAEVKNGVEAVLGAVDQILDADARGRLGALLPASLRATMGTASATRTMTTEAFIAVVASGGGYTSDRARYWAQAVLAALAENDADAAAIVAPALPDPSLMQPLGQGPAPVGSGVATGLSPRILDADEVARALRELPGWTGDTTRIVRTIDVPAERVSPLTDAVHRIESELNHHARIDDGTDGLTFTVWTHSLGRVTDLDLDLARRIDEAIETVA
jgi:pterin-4a-carbinolamine dehydratase/uncharacterized protein (DUF2267 family)